MKGVFFGSGALAVAVGVGLLFGRGANLQLGEQSESSPQPVAATEEKSEEALEQEKMAQLEGEVAFGTLKNRAEILEEQKKQQILSGKLAKQAEDEQANATAANTVRLPSQPVARRSSRSSSSFPRLPYSSPSPRVVPSAVRPSSRSVPPGSLSSSPAPSHLRLFQQPPRHRRQQVLSQSHRRC